MIVMFYPPKGTGGGPIVFTYVISPEGTLQSRYQRRSNGRRSRRPSEARLIKCISTYTCNTIKKMAAKPPNERSEANKVASEARLMKFISTYTCNTIQKTAAKPPTDGGLLPRRD